MAETAVLQTDPRTRVGKQAAKDLRRAGRLPAVVYGESGPSLACTVDRKALTDILHAHGRNVILSLVVGGESQNTMVKEIQHHPLRGDIVHVDFQRISLTRSIVVEVPLVAAGIPVGVRSDGGILERMLHSIQVECLPTEIPESIQVDVSEMRIGQSLHVADLQAPASVRIVTEPDRSVFVVVPPTVLKSVAEEQEVAAVEEEAKEPEVIERGKREEDEEEEDEK